MKSSIKNCPQGYILSILWWIKNNFKNIGEKIWRKGRKKKGKGEKGGERGKKTWQNLIIKRGKRYISPPPSVRYLLGGKILFFGKGGGGSIWFLGKIYTPEMVNRILTNLMVKNNLSTWLWRALFFLPPAIFSEKFTKSRKIASPLWMY